MTRGYVISSSDSSERTCTFDLEHSEANMGSSTSTQNKKGKAGSVQKRRRGAHRHHCATHGEYHAHQGRQAFESQMPTEESGVRVHVVSR
jgi:hypothetical protein